MTGIGYVGRAGAAGGRVENTGDNLGVLREAIARSAGMVLSLPYGGRLRHHKSRFLADAGDGFWVESVPAERLVVEQLISTGQPAGVTFRNGEHKVIFAAAIQHLEPHYERSAAVDEPAGPVEALLLKFPAEVRSVQRRKSFRVPVHDVPELEVRAWLMTEQAHLRDKPPAAREIDCEARDLSVGGIGLSIRGVKGAGAPALAVNDRVRIQLTLRGTTALLEGRLRYPPRASPGGAFRAGVEFRTLTDSREDRTSGSQLTKIVNDLQRNLIRRKKLGF